MTPGEKDQYDMKTDVELLKRDVSNFQGLLARLDTAIDKIADVSNGISKILAVHEQAIDGLRSDVEERKRMSERENELIHRRISDMKDESTEQRNKHHEALLKKIDELEERHLARYNKIDDRLSVLEKWKWWVMGAAAAVGFIMAKLPSINP